MKQPRRNKPAGRTKTGRRKASVMILVVALLALLALMGVAWLSTARSQRVMSQQGVFSSGVQQGMDGAVDVTLGAIVDAIRGRDTGTANVPTYRRASYGGQTSTYLNADFHGTYWDDTTLLHEIAAGNQYLASRVPLVSGSGASAIVYWPAISAPVSSPRVVGLVQEAQRQFESPWGGGKYSTRVSQASGVTIRPAFVTIKEGSPGGPSRTHPAFNINGTVYLAADTTGGGIADAGLSRLVQVGDITYYVAYRALDNNSAINVSTAWKPFDTSSSGPDAGLIPVGNFFPSNINLLAMLTDQPAGSTVFRTVDKQMDLLNSFRLGNVNNPPWQTMLDDSNGSVGTFSSLYEALWMQLGRRVDYPGRITGTTFYNAVSAAEAGRMASGFLLAPYGDQISLEAGVPADAIDSALFETLCLGPTVPYSWPRYSVASGVPDDSHVQRWFYQNFDYGRSGVGYSVLDRSALTWTDNFGFSRRPLLVSRNGVSQGVPSVPESGSYPQAPEGKCPTPYDMPTKASLNTADFSELWRAYFMVMAGDPAAADTTPFATVAGINVATDNALYRGQKFKADGTPDTSEQSLYRMFRSSVRTNQVGGGAGRLTPAVMVQLRAALAAINTISLRGGNPSTYTANDTINVTLTDGSSLQVYGLKPQVFITEIYAENDWISDPQTKGPNPNGYVAIELQNPCTQGVNINGWKIAALDRSNMSFTDIHTFNGTTVQGRDTASPSKSQNLIVIDNFDENGSSSAKAAKYRPKAIADPTKPVMSLDGGATIYVEKLSDVLGKELVILRPPAGGGGADLSTWIPVDSFDFTTFKVRAKLEKKDPFDTGQWAEAFSVPADLTTVLLRSEVTLWHYARNSKNTEPFKCVYPGRYYVSSIAANDNRPRQQGTRTRTWNTIEYAPPANPGDPPNPATLTYKPAAAGSTTADPLDSGLDTAWPSTLSGSAPTVDTGFGLQSVSTYRDSEFTIQWGGQDVPGPGGTDTTWMSYNKSYPYGGFARNLDALHVPFIGSYVIKQGGSVVEMNAVTMDAVAAEDTDPQDDPSQALSVSGSNFKLKENIGRFTPVRAIKDDGTAALAGVNPLNDFEAIDSTRWRYRWAMKLPDYLTVQAPWADRLPDAPKEYTAGGALAVPNTPGGLTVANTDVERTVPVQGLVNINTAPVPVLAAVPFLNWARDTSISPPYQQWLQNSTIDERLAPLNETGTAIALPAKSPIYGRDIFASGLSNLDVAEYIVYYRDVNDGTGKPHGPFRSIWDLYQVTVPTDMNDLANPAKRFPLFHSLTKAITNVREPGSIDGDISRYFSSNAAIVDGVRNDFEEQFFMLNRVSNLITTRSDSFTVYVLVQGWRGAGTANPELVSQQRIGLLVDRSGVTRTKHEPKVTVFPLK